MEGSQTHTDVHRCTQTHTDAHRRTRTNADERRRTRMNADARGRMQTNARQTASGVWADATSRRVQTLDGMGLCLYVDLCFHASSLPCLHTFWHAIPTSFYILYFLVAISNNQFLHPAHSFCTSAMPAQTELLWNLLIYAYIMLAKLKVTKRTHSC